MNIPKIDLHLHLDGSLRPLTLLELAKEDNLIDLNTSIEEIKEIVQVNENDKDLVAYLSKFRLPISTLNSEQRLERVGYEIIEDLAMKGYIYSEIRFAPQLHMNDNLSMKQVIDSVNKGMNKSSKDYSFPYGIILCSMRHLPLSKSVEVIRAANAYKDNENIVAVDLAGDEFNFSPDIFKNSFRQSQLPITIHAGEALGAESVLSAINMGANRIGHGIRSIEDDNVINLLLEKNIALEVCPKSNKQTNVYKNFSDYPIKQLFDKGLSITLNSDNLTVSNTSFEEEVNILKNNFGFNNQNIKSMLLNSAFSIFNSDNLKSDLSSKIESDFKLKKSSKNKP